MSLVKLATVCVTIVFLAQLVTAARILAIMSTASRSHHIWNRSLMLALASRGHHVTVLSPDPEKMAVANHTDIVIEGAYKNALEVFNYEEMGRYTYWETVISIYEFGSVTCKHSIESKGAKTLMQSKEKYDLIIVEVAMAECLLGFVHKMGNPPVVGITAFSIPTWANYILANPDNPAYTPNIVLPLTDHMGFKERFMNSLINSFTMYYRQKHHMPYMEQIAREHFGESLPSLSELESRISLILVNAHFSMDYPRPLIPAMVPVGGMHITPSRPLPQDLQKYLDEAENGVIFFSLGSNLRSDQMGPEKIQAFLEAFQELPQRVLWKWESETLPGQPGNVMLGKWLPQNDILGHPNVRLFITHAGLLSTQEAVYHGVPVVGMPFMADQLINIHKAMSHGVGEKLDYSTLSKDAILLAVRKVITTPSYRLNMRRLSAQFRDQPQSPLERAVFWTEYVIRHKGAPHLRSAALDLPWYQHLLLDVIASLLLALAAALAVVWFILRAVLHLLRGKKELDIRKKLH